MRLSEINLIDPELATVRQLKPFNMAQLELLRHLPLFGVREQWQVRREIGRRLRLRSTLIDQIAELEKEDV